MEKLCGSLSCDNGDGSQKSFERSISPESFMFADEMEFWESME